ncbi:hypothetical protein KO361_06340 [Candidatus Woesearchaeota archaeon]|jgi:hypothetical protein|nr:hypothetical protein [Candidatus Woesearchaeota archaeon]
MKRINYFLIVLLIYSCNSTPFKDYEENLIYLNNLKGNVKTIISETFSAEEKFGEPIKGEITNPDFDLSEYLNVLTPPNSKVEFSENGKLMLIEVNNSYLSYSLKHSYDKNWNRIEMSFKYNENETIHKFINENNRIISGKTYNKEGEEIKTSKFNYVNGNLSEIISIDTEGTIIEKIKYIYENGTLAENTYGKTGDLVHYIKKDIYGRYIETLFYENNKFIFKYNGQKPFPKEILSYSDNDLTGKMTISLDENDNIIETRLFDEDGEVETIHKYFYKYDKEGNWIERILYENDNIENITIRTIEYY